MTNGRNPKLIAHLPKTMQMMIRMFVRRIDNGKNCLIVGVGETGSGKSFMMVSLMFWTYVFMHGRKPTIEEMKGHWVFRAGKFLEKMNDPKLKKKEVWLWDEAGVDISHKAHASVQNRAIGWLVQTFRNQKQIVFFTVPTMAFIDASVRKLLHFQIETKKIIPKKNVCIVKPLRLQYNIRLDKLFYHNLRALAIDGTDNVDEIEYATIPRPEKDIEEAYEEDKFSFTSDLNKDIQKIIRSVERKKEREGLDITLNKPLSARQEQILSLLKGGVTKTMEIAKIIGCKPPSISENFKWMMKKGVDVNELRGNKDHEQIIQPNIANR